MTPIAATPFDVAIIGAGPAGSAAAAWLAGRGRNVVCFERGWFPRHTIGESLLPRCNDLLQEAGLFEAVKARGYMPKRGATFLRGDEVERFCFARGLPGDVGATFQVPRDDFDKTLAAAARARGADLRFGHEVEAAHADEGGAKLSVRDVESGEAFEARARFLLDCSGPGRVLAKLWRLELPASLPTRSAHFTMVEGDERPEGELEGDIWVCLHPRGVWLWIIPFSDGRTSVGVVGDDDRFDQAAGARERLFDAVRTDPNAARRLRRAAPVLRTMSLRAWTTSTARTHGPGWALAGNAGDFLDPVFSSGVCLALESSLLAARLADDTLSGLAVDWQASFNAPVASAVSVFRSFVQGWYRGDIPKIFFAREKLDRIQRQVTSVLGGNVLNQENPLVRDPEGTLRTLLSFVERLGLPLTLAPGALTPLPRRPRACVWWRAVTAFRAAPARLVIALAASASCAHCSSAESWDDEGRVYATVEAGVARAASSLVDRPVDAGDAVYAASFEIPGGFVRQPWSDARAFIEFPLGVTLGDGDEPVLCVEYAATETLFLRNCAGLSFAGAEGVDADLSGGQVYRHWLADLPRSIDTIDVRRVSFEVRRPESAPSLEASLLKLWVVDGSCDKVLASRAAALACNPAAGEDCSWVNDYTIEVDGVVCRMRFLPD